MTITPIQLKFWGGVWEQLSGAFLWARDVNATDQAVGNRGGESVHTLTADEMPSHSHRLPTNHFLGCWGAGAKSFSGVIVSSPTWGTAQGWTKEQWGEQGVNCTNQLCFDQAQLAMTNSGGIQPHNNMPPFYITNIWRRVA